MATNSSPIELKRTSILPQPTPTILTRHITSLEPLPSQSPPNRRKTSLPIESEPESVQNLIFSRRFASTREILNHLYARQNIDISLLKDALYTSNVDFLTEVVSFELDRLAEVNHDLELYFTQVINPGCRAGELAVMNWLGLNKGPAPLTPSTNYLFNLFSGFHHSSLVDFFRILRSRDNWANGAEFREAIAQSPLHHYRQFLEQHMLSVSAERREYFLLSYVIQLTFQPTKQNQQHQSPHLASSAPPYTDFMSNYLGTSDSSASLTTLFPDDTAISIQSHYNAVCGLCEFVIAILYSSGNVSMFEALLGINAPAISPTPNTQHPEYIQVEHCNEIAFAIRATLIKAGLSSAFGAKCTAYESIQALSSQLTNQQSLNLDSQRVAEISQTIQSLQHEHSSHSELFSTLIARFGPDFWSIPDIKQTFIIAQAYGDQESIARLFETFGITLANFWTYNHTTNRAQLVSNEAYLGGLSGYYEWYDESFDSTTVLAKEDLNDIKLAFYSTILPQFSRRGLTTALKWVCEFEKVTDLSTLLLPEAENLFAAFASGHSLHTETFEWLLQHSTSSQLILHNNHEIHGASANCLLQLFKSPASLASRIQILTLILQHISTRPQEFPPGDIGISLYDFCVLLRDAMDVQTWKFDLGLPLGLFRLFIQHKLITRDEWDQMYFHHPVEFCALINCAVRGGEFEELLDLDNQTYSGSNNMALLSTPISNNTDNGQNRHRVDITALSHLQLQTYYNDLTELFEIIFPAETYSHLLHDQLKLDQQQLHLVSSGLIEFAMTTTHLDLVTYLFKVFNPTITAHHFSSLIISSLVSNDHRNLLSFYQLPTPNNFHNLSLIDTELCRNTFPSSPRRNSTSTQNLAQSTLSTLSSQHYELFSSTYGDYANFLSTLDEIDFCSQELLSSIPDEYHLTHERLASCPSVLFKEQLFGPQPSIFPGLDITNNEFNQCNDPNEVEHSYVLRNEMTQPVYSLSHFSPNEQSPQQPQQPQQSQQQERLIPRSLSFEPNAAISTHPTNLHSTLSRHLNSQYTSSDSFLFAFQWLCRIFELNNTFPYFERSPFLSILDFLINHFFETFNDHQAQQYHGETASLCSFDLDNDDHNFDPTLPLTAPSSNPTPPCTAQMIRKLLSLLIDQSILTLLSTNPHGILITILAQLFPQYTTQFWSTYALTARALQLSAQSLNNLIWLDDFMSWGLIVLSLTADDKANMHQLYTEYQHYILQPHDDSKQQHPQTPNSPIGPICDYIKLRQSYLLAQTQLFQHQLLDEYDVMWEAEQLSAEVTEVSELYPYSRSELRPRDEIELTLCNYERCVQEQVFPASLVYNFSQYIKTAASPFQFGPRASNYLVLESLTAIITTSTTTLPRHKQLQEAYNDQLQEYNANLPHYTSQQLQPPPIPDLPQELHRCKQLNTFQPFLDHLHHLTTQLYRPEPSQYPSTSTFPQILLKAFYVVFTTSSLHAICDVVDLYLSLGGEIVPPIQVSRQDPNDSIANINANKPLQFRPSIASTSGQNMTVVHHPPPNSWLFSAFPAHFHVHMQNGEIESRHDEYATYYVFIVKNVHQIDLQKARFLVAYRYKYFVQHVCSIQQELSERLAEEQRLRDAMNKEKRKTRLQRQSTGPSYLDQLLDHEYFIPILTFTSTAIAGVVGYLLWQSTSDKPAPEPPKPTR